MSDFDQPPQPAHASSSLPQTAPAAAADLSASERARLDQQAYLQHALAVSVIGVWHVDIATGAQWWSAETYQLFGVDPSTAPLTVDAFYARVHPEDRERVRAATRRALETGAVYDVEHRIVTPLGLEKWVHERASVERAADGTPARLVGVVHDITDTRLAEEALRASRGRLQAIVQNMPVLMTALDDDGHFVFWNHECERVTGFSADEVLDDPGFVHRFIPDPIERARMRRDVPTPRQRIPRLGADRSPARTAPSGRLPGRTSPANARCRSGRRGRSASTSPSASSSRSSSCSRRRWRRSAASPAASPTTSTTC